MFGSVIKPSLVNTNLNKYNSLITQTFSISFHHLVTYFTSQFFLQLLIKQFYLCLCQVSMKFWLHMTITPSFTTQLDNL